MICSPFYEPRCCLRLTSPTLPHALAMRTFLSFILSSLLAAAGCLPSRAQAPTAALPHDIAPHAATPTGRFYAGIAASVGTYVLPEGTVLNRVAPLLTAGMHIRPRVAWQVGVSYYQQEDSYSTSRPLSSPTGPSSVFIVTNTAYRALLVPVSLRYRLTRTASHRFQTEVVGGLTLVHAGIHQVQTTDDTRTFTSASVDTQDTCLYWSFGPGFSYRVTTNLALTGEGGINWLVNKQTAGTPRPSAILAAGFRYSFSQR